MKELIQQIVNTKGQVVKVSQNRDEKGRFVKGASVQPVALTSLSQDVVTVAYHYNKGETTQVATVFNGATPAHSKVFFNDGTSKGKTLNLGVA